MAVREERNIKVFIPPLSRHHQDILRQQPREISNLIHKLIDRKVGRL